MTPWSWSVGTRPYRVVAEERPDRGGRVYLRWWGDRNWQKKATGLTVRNKAGDLVASRVAKVEREVRVIHARISNRLAVDPVETEALTLTGGLAAVVHPFKGKYPKDTPHRREVMREMRHAVEILGDVEWATLRPSHIRTLYRKRQAALQAKGHDGQRGAEITVARLLAVAEWLRGEEMIPAGCCRAPKGWREELGGAVDPKRPRHTVEELRAVLAVALKVDPRLALALELGAELRLGQVLRCRRSDLDLATNRLRVRGAGKKAGVVTELIPSQRAAVDRALAGYLAPLETGEDYPLFPSGQLTKGRTDPTLAVCRPEQRTARPVDRRAVLRWFHEAEALAGITPQEGRGWYGLRRAGVDGFKKESGNRDALKSFGGWSDTQVPDRIYAAQEAEHAMAEAASVRAKIRGVGTE